MTDEDDVNVLNFTARVISKFSGDKVRKFVVSFYLMDHTLSIYEMAVPNSGFRPGKFLQRTRVRNALTKRFFQESDFYVGAKIGVSGRIFELQDAATHTLCLMEADADNFPEANIEHVIGELKSACLKMADKIDIRALFESKDTDKTGLVPVSDAKEIFSMFLPNITNHAIITLTRAFERDQGQYEYSYLIQNMNI